MRTDTERLDWVERNGSKVGVTPGIKWADQEHVDLRKRINKQMDKEIAPVKRSIEKG